MSADSFDRASLKEGIVAAWPVCPGYFAIGLALGVLAQKAGLAPWQIGLMSLLVYAGSSQFIAVSMLAGGAGAAAVIFTTLIVNLRHLLMSSALSVHLKKMDRKIMPLFAYGVTDESFAVNMTRFRQGDWDWQRSLWVNHTANLAWVLSTTLGGLSGQFVPVGALGIDFAPPAMFIGLLLFQMKSYEYVFVAIFAGLMALLISLIAGGFLHILAGALIAALAGVLARRKNLFGRRG
ncbi:MAG: AzlC family ABC transporter permease [Smithellaceae bacterium]|nr:AzlC family ABC transporter permease [Smithellaceae bacterium]